MLVKKDGQADFPLNYGNPRDALGELFFSIFQKFSLYELKKY